MEVELMFMHGKWHLHSLTDGKCLGAFLEKVDAIKAAHDPIHNYVIKELPKL